MDLRTELNRFRQRLLDLTSRNPLLNYRISRTRTLRIVDEQPDFVFERLVERRKAFRLAAVEPTRTDDAPDDAPDGASNGAPDVTVGVSVDVARDGGSGVDPQPVSDAGTSELVGQDPASVAATAGPDSTGLDSIGSESTTAAQTTAAQTTVDSPNANVISNEVISAETISDSEARQPSLFDDDDEADLSLPMSDESGGESGDRKTTHFDEFLQTTLAPERLDAQLRNMQRAATTAIEETGINYLHLAIGFLAWTEQDDSEVERIAPLVLIPVEIERYFDGRSESYRYQLRWSEEEIQHNLCLEKRLERDFGIRLPSVDEDERPEAYFRRVARAVGGKSNWRVRREAMVGFFSFHKLMMYADLAAENWDQTGALDDDSILSRVVCGGDGEDGPALYAREYDVDVDEIARSIPLTLDTDSSQHSALVDIAKGRHLVIEGPPGTGKSQTITAGIAAALQSGKTVLFVAEKMAALSVVHSKLRSIGLADFCLELHSETATPRRVFESLKQRVGKAETRPPDWDEVADSLSDSRGKLADYLAATAKVVEPINRPLHELFWQIVELRGRGFEPIGSEQPEGSEGCVASDGPIGGGDKLLGGDGSIAAGDALDRRVKSQAFRRAVELLGVLATATAEIDDFRASPWWGFCPSRPVNDSTRVIQQTLTSMRQTLADTDDAGTQLDATFPSVQTPRHSSHWNDLSQTEVPDRIDAWCEAFASPQPVDRLDLVRRLLPADARRSARTASETVERYQADLAEVSKRLLLDFDRAVEALKPRLFRLRPWVPRLGGLKISAIKELRVWASDAGRTVGEMIRLGAWLDGLGLGPARSEDEFEAATTRWRMFRHDCVSEPDEIGPGLFSAEAQRTWQRGATQSHKLSGRVKPFAQRMHLESVPPRDELLEIAAKLRPRVGSFFRWLSGDYRAASAAIKRFWQPDFPAPVALRLQTIEQYITLLDELAKFAEDVGLRRTFGTAFVGARTDWQRLKLQIGWVAMARKQGLDHAAVMRIFQSIADNTASHTTDDLITASERFASQFAVPDRVALLGGSAESVARASMVELARRIDQLATALAEIDTVAGCFSTLRSGLVSDAIRLATLTCETAERRQVIRQNADWPQLLGRWFDATQTDWQTIRSQCDAIDASVDAGMSEAELAELISDMPADEAVGKLRLFVGRLRRINGLRSEWAGHRQRLGAFGEIDDSWLDWDSGHDSPGDLSVSVSRLLDRVEDVAPWASFMMLVGQCRAAGLSPIIDAMLRGLAPDRMADTYRLTVLQRVADHEVSLEPCLSQFSRQTIEAARASFQRLDRQSQVLNRDLVAHDVAQRQAIAGVSRGRVRELTEMGLIAHEIQKQTRFCRVRDLMRRAGRSVQALKPCFMMSPLSVAQFIDPTSLKFDLVIMDEASQIRPEDALGALMRADQMVVVGDPKQLPPTSFFDFGGDDVDDDEATIVDNTESILEVAMKTCQPVRRLRWHYRSRHENLIAFSNDRFYDGDLIVFPSPSNQSGLLGVSLEFVEGGIFKDRRNLPEAVAVADAAIRHAIEFPGESLGIGTFNISQAELVADLIDKRCGADPQAREAIDAISGEHEPLFIKNLENLQGDERDVIFISYTYGPDAASGRVFNRFGPINSDGGWRRLNVMVTRARSRVRVFASFRPEDINVGPQSSRGVVAFRDYLRFAQTGRLPEQAIMTGRAPDSPFEIAVARVVQSMGLQAVPQVGVAGYFIDIGVRHPDSGDFILGIECDGATYHSSLSARDRDRLREEVIRSRGWNLHRIWSTDWFWQQSFEIERLRAAITASLKGTNIAEG